MTDDLDRGFARLAAHAHRTGRLDSAASVRDRGDRRRRRRYLAVTALAAVALATAGAGLGVAWPQRPVPQVAEPPPPSSAGPSSSAAPSRSASPSVSPAPSRSAGGVLGGGREIYLFPLEFGEPVPEFLLSVAADQDDRVVVSSDYGNRSLFVPVPAGDGTYLVKTARLRIGGEAPCWQRKSNAPELATVLTAPCDAGDANQRWRFTPLSKDAQGRQTYGVHVGDEYLLWNPEGEAGLVMRRHADDELRTTFVLIDRGAADLPGD